MAVIGGALESPNKLRVEIVNYLTDDTNSAPNGIICDEKEIPPYPDYEPGKRQILYVDPTIKNPTRENFWFEEIEVPLTPEEEQVQLLKTLQERLNKVEAGLATVKGDITTLKTIK